LTGADNTAKIASILPENSRREEMSLAHNPDELARAQAFADRMESKMREIGLVGDFFCESQRQLWRQHAIRGYLGQSPDPKDEAEAPSRKPTAFPGRRRA